MIKVTVLVLLTLGPYDLFGQKESDTFFLNKFRQPINYAKPIIWWHWMNGNITEEGIYKDLTWMKRAGIGGFQNFDAAWSTPQIVKYRLVYMQPGWVEAFKYATVLADSLKLEMAIAGSPGWSESGGAWVPVENGMKKIVWSELKVVGGANKVVLPRPPASQGTFQNIPLGEEFSNQQGKLPALFKDIAVVAFRLPSSERSMVSLQPVVGSSGGRFDLNQLVDGDLEKTVSLPADTVARRSWIGYSFKEAVTIKAVTIMGQADRAWNMGAEEVKYDRVLESSEDGVHFSKVAYLPVGETRQQTIDVPAVTSRYFRVSFKNAPPTRGNRHPGIAIGELVLHTVTKVQRAEDKAAFAPAAGLMYESTAFTADTISVASIIDLTYKLKADGTLDWRAPEGNWSILRFGYTVMGTTNHPATTEATGFEVDKMDPAAIKRYFTRYLDMYKNASGGLMGSKGVQYMVTDSWEAGAQNWTANMPAEFRQRRGYNIMKWLPTLAGYVVGSAEASDRFLFDFRKTISEMVSEYHYDQLTDILASYGMKRYTESHENGRNIIADGMEIKRRAAIPMSAMWTPHKTFNHQDLTPYEADIRESASVAHLYGQNLVAAESLTSFGYGGYAFQYAPEHLKPTADLELASGLNRFVIHCSPHQPVDDKFPGLSLGPFGQWFDRHETWAEQAYAWTDYLSRSCYMLQQGKMVADILYYYGEDDNITSLFKTKLPVIPEGYNYDFINSDALLNLLSVKDGKLFTPSGMSYRLLVLDSNARRIPLRVLQKIQSLIQQGAVVAGVKPEHSTGLMDNETLFQNMLTTSWNKPNVYTNQYLGSVLNAMKLQPDFRYAKVFDSTKLLIVHRTLPDREIYWVNSRNNQSQTVEASFRVTGRIPELWFPETGKTSSASYTISPSSNTTTVTLPLAPNDAFFVVFKEKASSLTQSYTVPAIQPQTLSTISGPWTIAFQQERGAPSTAVFDSLVSYTKSAVPGIKYFSGTASYRKTISIEPQWLSKQHALILDLGAVKNLAEVIVNGKSLGILWHAPFTIDISAAAKPGPNNIEIKVTNLWVNRLIGDQQPGATPITWTSETYYGADAPLIPSGLLGPVTLITQIKTAL